MLPLAWQNGGHTWASGLFCGSLSPVSDRMRNWYANPPNSCHAEGHKALIVGGSHAKALAKAAGPSGYNRRGETVCAVHYPGLLLRNLI